MDLDFVKLPESSYLIFTIWAFCVFIAWYVYRLAFRSHRGAFLLAVGLMSVVALVILAFKISKARPAFRPTRITVFPFLKKSPGGELLSWESLAISEITTEYLNQGDRRTRLAHETEWVMRAANYDSLGDSRYLIDFARRTKTDFAVLGAFEKDRSEYRLNFRVLDVDSETELLTESIRTDFDGLPSFCTTLAARVGNGMVESNGTVTHESPWASISQMEDHFNAKLYYLTGQTDPAFELAQSAVGDSSSTKSLNLLAELYLRRALEKKGRGESALDDFKACKSTILSTLLLHPENATARRLLAELYLANEKWGQAEENLRQLHRLVPYDPWLYTDLSQLHRSRYLDLGFGDEEDLLKFAIEINPMHFVAYLDLAKYYAQKRRYGAAFNVIEAVLSINPQDVDALMTLGSLYLAQSMKLEVLDTFEKVVNLRPGYSDAYYNIGVAYYHERDYANAIEYFDHAIQLDEHLDSHLYLAYIYDVTGDTDRAIEYLRTRIKRRRNQDDRFAEEARKHLFKIMKERGAIDSLIAN